MKMIPSLLLLSLLLVTPLWAVEAKPNLEDPETRERILDGAKNDGELEWRGEAGKNPDEKGAKEISDSKDNRDDDTNTDGYFISPSLNAVHIRYSNKVNGYKVEALWSPTEIELATKDDFYFAKGPAIIKLIHKDGGIITVVNNYFTLHRERIAGLSIEYNMAPPYR